MGAGFAQVALEAGSRGRPLRRRSGRHRPRPGSNPRRPRAAAPATSISRPTAIDAWVAADWTALRFAHDPRRGRDRSRPRHRGRPRGSRAQAGDLPGPRCRGRRRRHPRDQHQRPVRRGHRLRDAPPSRVLGLHFFNPVPLMALVEVVATAADRRRGRRARRSPIVTAWGKTPVRSADSPGFIVNRVNRPFTIEALRPARGRRGVDRGHRLGPARGGLPAGSVRAHGSHRPRRHAGRGSTASGRASAGPTGPAAVG